MNFQYPLDRDVLEVIWEEDEGSDDEEDAERQGFVFEERSSNDISDCQRASPIANSRKRSAPSSPCSPHPSEGKLPNSNQYSPRSSDWKLIRGATSELMSVWAPLHDELDRIPLGARSSRELLFGLQPEPRRGSPEERYTGRSYSYGTLYSL